MCRTCIALSQCLLILKPQGKIQPSLWLGFPKNSYTTSETLQQIFSRAFPWTQMNKMGNQLPSGALCNAAATVSSLAAFKQSMTSYRQGLHLPADCKHHKQDRNKPKNSAAVCKVSKESSHDPPANTPDCYSDSLHRRAWLWCRPVVCKPGFYHYHLSFTASAPSGGRRVCCKLSQ